MKSSKKLKQTSKSKKTNFTQNIVSLRLIIFVVIFGGIGTYFLINSFAATSILFTSTNFVSTKSTGATIVKDTASTNKNNTDVVEVVNTAEVTTANAVLTNTTLRLDSGVYKACLNMRTVLGSATVTLDITNASVSLPGTVMGTGSAAAQSNSSYVENICFEFTNSSSNIAVAANVRNKTAGTTIRVGNVNLNKIRNLDPPAPSSDAPLGATGSWSKSFSDEFDDPTSLTNKWNILTGTLSYDQACYTNIQGSNGNLEVKNNMLIIRTKYAPGSCSGRNYTSGYLRTDAWSSDAEEYTISPTTVPSGIIRIEMKAQMPTGRGIWPGLWSRNNFSGSTTSDPYGELDLIERWGDEKDTKTYKSTTFNTPGKTSHGSVSHIEGRKCPIPPGDTTFQNNCEDLTTGMHVYAVEIDQRAAAIRYYLDGRLTTSHTSSTRSNKDTNNDPATWKKFDPTAWINSIKGEWDLRIMTQVIAVDDQWHPEPDASFGQAELKVDYVRVFTKN